MAPHLVGTWGRDLSSSVTTNWISPEERKQSSTTLCYPSLILQVNEGYPVRWYQMLLRGQIQQGLMHNPYLTCQESSKVQPMLFLSHIWVWILIEKDIGDMLHPRLLKLLNNHLLNQLPKKERLVTRWKSSSILGSSNGFLKRGWTKASVRGKRTIPSLKEKLTTARTRSGLTQTQSNNAGHFNYPHLLLKV